MLILLTGVTSGFTVIYLSKTFSAVVFFFIYFVLSLFHFEARSHYIALAELEFARKTRLALNSWQAACLGAKIKSVHLHTLLLDFLLGPPAPNNDTETY